MTNALAALVFAAYLLTAGLAGVRRSRRAVEVFRAYSLLVSFGVGLTQRDLWPFSSWPLVAGELPPTVTQRRIVAVDERGVEHDVDYRAWYPMSAAELNSWMGAVFVELDPVDRDEAAMYLTGVAESWRRQALETGKVGDFGRFLGPLAAPFFLVSPSRWADPGAVPEVPLVGIRLYYEHWSPEGIRTGRDSIVRELVYPSEGLP